MKKLVLAGLVFGSLAMAQTYYDVLPYGGYINYTGSTTKDNGYVGGIYLSAFQSPWKTELDVEHTNISYKSETTTSTDSLGRTTTTTTTQPDLKQNDFTGIIHYYEGYNLAYKLGMHYIDSTDSTTDKGQVYIAGILYYQTLMFNIGADIYYSNYSNTSTSPTLYQISPKAGINFGDYNSMIGSFYAQAKLDYIQVGDNRSDNDLKNSYTSLELTLNNYNGDFSASFSGWIGKRSYAVENGGFIVNNIGDEQTGGIKISENYKIDRVQSVKAEFDFTKFKENGNSFSQTLLASYSYSF